MADYDEPRPSETLNSGRAAAAAMVVIGMLVAVGTTLWTLFRFGQLAASPPDARGVVDFMAAAALLLAGWGAGVLLWGAAEVLRRLDDLLAAQRETTGAIPRTAAGAERRDAPSTRLLEELVSLTRETRDIALLSDAERAKRLATEADEALRMLEHDVPRLLREHNWQLARQRVQHARRRFPLVAAWDRFDEQVEAARAQIENHDIEVATREVDELAALGAWDRAIAVIRELRQRHPNAKKAIELAQRVTIARDRATAEERARLMSQAQEASTRRRWREALGYVEDLVRRFPESPEAHELRGQLPTLRDNAEIQTRQEMEARIRELIKEQRFGEALDIAHALLERYPNSPQAAVLRDQLPRLEQRVGARR